MLSSALDLRTRLLAVAVITVAAAACGTTQPTSSPAASHAPTSAPSSGPTIAPTPAPTATTTPAPSDGPAPASLLLEVTNEGGFIAPSAHLGELPIVVVDIAGDIYTADPNSTAATLIPQVVVRDVGANGAAQILAAMRAAGLDKEASDGGPGNPDAGVTVFTAEIDGQEIVNRVAVGGPGGPGHPGSSPQPALDLLDRLLDTSQTWGAADVANAAFTSTAYKVYVAQTTDSGTGRTDWPLAPSLADFGTPATPDFGVTGLRTGVVSGVDASTLATALAKAPAGETVLSEGHVFQVWIRPLLPPELAQ